MISRLLNEIEGHVGFRIRSKGDCLRLSDIILESTDEDISYNTLRRLYGLAGSVQPRTGTLDVLSRLLGYRNYSDFTLSSPINARWHEKEAVLLMVSHGQIEGSMRRIEEIENDSLRLDVALQLAREWAIGGEYRRVVELLELPSLDVRPMPYSGQLHFAHSLGLLFRSLEVDPALVLKSPRFQQTVYTLFVDYTSLNGYYGAWNDWYLSNHIEMDGALSLFNRCLAMLRRRLNGEDMGTLDLTGVDFAGLHPILRSRVFSVLWIPDFHWTWMGCGLSCMEVAHAKAPSPSVRFTKSSTSPSLLGDLELVDWLLDGLEIQTNRLQHHEYHDLQLYRLVEAVQLLHTGRKSQCRSALKKVDLELVNLSMKEMVSLLYQVVFLCSGRNRPEHWAHYDFLAAQVGVPIFDRSFVELYTQKD